MTTPLKMTPRVESVFSVLMVGNPLTTSQIAEKIKDTDYWKGKTGSQVRLGVASAMGEIRGDGLGASTKTPKGDGGQGEYEHIRFARRHSSGQKPMRNTKKSRKRGISETPINQVLAAAARIEVDAQKLGDALGALQDQFNTFKEIQELASKLSNGKG